MSSGDPSANPATFKMLTVKQIVSQIRSEDWFVTIDLKDAYFHISILPYHRKFLRFTFGGRAHQYQVLPFGLELSPRTFTKCVDATLAPLHLQGIRINELHRRLVDSSSVTSVGSSASRYRSCPHERVGVTAKRQKECAFSTTEDYFSWRGMGLHVDAGMPVTRTYRVHPVGCKSIGLGQSLTVKQFQRLLGLMAAASNVIHFGLLHMRPMQWWLRTKGFSPRGKPFRMIKVTRRC